MGFDADRFLATPFAPREQKVAIPDLRDFFGKKEKAAWRVRGLTGREYGRAREAREKNNALKAVVEGIASKIGKKQVEAIKKLIGDDKDVPEDIAFRVELLIIGSVEPQVDYPLANKLCETFPTEFYDITNRIIQLSGKGHVPGKQTPSGKTKRSEP